MEQSWQTHLEFREKSEKFMKKDKSYQCYLFLYRLQIGVREKQYKSGKSQGKLKL